MTREEIYLFIDKERARQDDKWGIMPRNNSDMVWLAVLTDEIGECARAILKTDWDNLKDEIIQVAAVAIAWLEDDENHNNGKYKVG